MICEAEKQAAFSVDAPNLDGYAKSLGPSFNAISKIADLGAQLRRPARRQLSRDAERELFIALAAKSAKELDALNPRGDALNTLISKFPAPEEWYKEG